MAKLQNEDFKTSAEIVSAGGTASQLLNDSKIYVTGNGINDTLSNAIVNGQIGGGGGSKNYLTVYTAGTSGGVANPGNGDFERNLTTGWSLAHTTLSSKFPTSVAAAGTPFSSTQGGTAASGNLSLTVSSSTPLQKKYMGVLASSAASVAGDLLISDAFYIDPEDQAKVLQFSFAYKVASGATNMDFSGTSSNTYAVYIYDVTGAAWIQPAGVYNLVQTSGVGICTGTFQTTASGTRYQIALVNITASAGAFTMNVDDFAVGPQTVSMGPAMLDWSSYTPVLTHTSGAISNYSVTGKWAQVGDTMHATGTITFSGASSVFAGLFASLPTGKSIDTSKLNTTTAGAQMFGTVTALDNGVQHYGVGKVDYYSTTAVELNAGDIKTHAGTAPLLADGFTNAFPFTFNTNDTISWSFSVPIVGWSSNTAQSSTGDQRVVDFVLNKATSITPAGTIASTFAGAGNVTYSGVTAVLDRLGGWNSITGIYTVPSSGDYQINGTWEINVNAGTGTYAAAYLSLNGVAISWGTPVRQTSATNTRLYPSISFLAPSLNAGDTIAIRILSDGTTPTWVASGVHSFTVQKVQGPSVLRATEIISASYLSTETTSITNNNSTILGSTAGSTTKEWDTTNSFSTSTGIFTVPVVGKYRVTAGAQLGVITNNQGNMFLLFQNNATTKKSVAFGWGSSGSLFPSVHGSIEIDCVAGDQLRVRVGQGNNSASAYSLTGGNSNNMVNGQFVQFELMK